MGRVAKTNLVAGIKLTYKYYLSQNKIIKYEKIKYPLSSDTWNKKEVLAIQDVIKSKNLFG